MRTISFPICLILIVLGECEIFLNKIIIPTGLGSNPLHRPELLTTSLLNSVDDIHQNQGRRWRLLSTQGLKQATAGTAERCTADACEIISGDTNMETAGAAKTVRRATEKRALQGIFNVVKETSGRPSYHYPQPTYQFVQLVGNRPSAQPSVLGDGLVQNAVSTISDTAGNILGSNDRRLFQSGLINRMIGTVGLVVNNSPPQPTSQFAQLVGNRPEIQSSVRGDGLIQDVVSTVSDTAANIGRSVLGSSSNDRGLFQGGVIDRMMGTVDLVVNNSPPQPTSQSAQLVRKRPAVQSSVRGGGLVQDVVSTVSDTAANIGRSVLGSSSNDRGLFQGGVIDKVVGTVDLVVSNHHPQPTFQFAQLVGNGPAVQSSVRGGGLLQDVVSTVSDTAANIGRSVLGSSSNDRGLFQGGVVGVIDRVRENVGSVVNNTH